MDDTPDPTVEKLREYGDLVERMTGHRVIGVRTGSMLPGSFVLAAQAAGLAVEYVPDSTASTPAEQAGVLPVTIRLERLRDPETSPMPVPTNRHARRAATAMARRR